MKELYDYHKKMVAALQQDIDKQELQADQLIKKLFGLATTLERTQVLVAAARERVELGNPPGKKGSIGDAVNWEALLSEAPRKELLYFISGDSDFASPLSKDRLSEFLTDEWTERKSSDLHFYTTLSQFFSSHEQFKDIDLKIEDQKERSVQDLAESPSFSMTHAIVRQLEKYDGFTPRQVARSCSGATRQRASGLDYWRR